MTDSPSLQEFLSVQEHFNFKRTALVEKDFYVVKALAAIAAADIAPFTLVFGGGTSLSRAHNLIRRMSEDIDLKITGDREPKRSELRRLRETITQALLNAGFQFDPENPDHRRSRNESRYTIYQIPYAAQAPGNAALRPEIQIEVAVWPLRLPPEIKPVRSFVAEAFGRPAEVPAISCVSITQTAAEKFVALTRRVAVELSGNDRERDPTLIRHLYDLHTIRSHYDPAETMALAATIIPHDVEEFGNQYPPYRADPLGETMKAIAALQTDAGYAASFDRLIEDMVYGEEPSFANCLETLNELVKSLPQS